MTDVDVGILAATRQSWKKRSVRDVLVDVMAENPGVGEQKLLKKFVEHLEEDSGDLAVTAEYAFINTYRRLQAEPTAEERCNIAKQRVEKAKKVADAACDHAEKVKAIKEQIMLLNLEMPNGKKLSDCTGRECDRFGGWFKTLAKKVGATKRVGDIFDETKLRAVYEQSK